MERSKNYMIILILGENVEAVWKWSAKCPNNLCCSQWAWCGSASAYCGAGCQPLYGKCATSAVTSSKVPTSLKITTSTTTKPTFFINGKNWGCIYDYAPVLKRIVAECHQLAYHTWGHLDLVTLTLGYNVVQWHLDSEDWRGLSTQEENCNT
ncbi:3400_t:CDS:2 [Diversispora eburnea]|uniref:3400_t:CDS:1 n=1 Tax=Diversispora eburnea TaxID=1213867 RepID=A0A9N9BDF2_9GLOM|nr:3400_t:CDS:2 [Diversispora eburnea]